MLITDNFFKNTFYLETLVKLILALTLLFSVSIIANEAATTQSESAVVQATSGAKVEVKKEKKKLAKEAYLKAKNECLAENKELKGKTLKDCIVKKQAEAK
jgi:hypothetical protein